MPVQSDTSILEFNIKILPGRNALGPVLDAFVSQDQGLMCIELEVSSPSSMADAVWIRTSRGGAPLARQS